MKRIGVVAGVLLFIFVVPVILMGALLALSGDELAPSRRALAEIPGQLIDLYRGAASTCDGLDWTVLAAIHEVETHFGSGPTTSSAGAEGPMQFMPTTFATYGVDGNGDGDVQINDVEDAVFSAANLLCANGAGDPAHLATAIWDYNHSNEYVAEVLGLAASYGVLAPPDGVAFAASSDLVHDPHVVLTPNARADLVAGTVDHRLTALLSWIAQRHTIAISVFKTGHSKYVEGTDHVSNHYYGRAADIFLVDGTPVSVFNRAARQLVLELAQLPDGTRPNELGHPFGSIGFPGGFTDANHADHVHIGFD